MDFEIHVCRILFISHTMITKLSSSPYLCISSEYVIKRCTCERYETHKWSACWSPSWRNVKPPPPPPSLSLIREGRWCIIDDFATSFRHLPLFSTALWDSPTPGLSIPWCCLPTSSSVCLVFFSLSLWLARWFWPDLMNERHDHITAVYVSLRWSGGLCVVWLLAGSWHGLPSR